MPKRGMVPSNPFAHLPVAKAIAKRERVLSDQELAEIWRAACVAAAPYGSIVPLLLLTDQRRGEVAGMAWSELSAAQLGEQQMLAAEHIERQIAVAIVANNSPPRAGARSRRGR